MGTHTCTHCQPNPKAPRTNLPCQLICIDSFDQCVLPWGANLCNLCCIYLCHKGWGALGFFPVVHQVALTVMWWTHSSRPHCQLIWSHDRPPEVPPAAVHHLFYCTSGSHVDPGVSFTLVRATFRFVPVQKAKHPNTLTFTHTCNLLACCMIHLNNKNNKNATGSADTCIQLGFNRHRAAACQEGVD